MRERYARGEIDWPEYQEAPLNLLKARYLRDEPEPAEYEERVSRVIGEGARGHDGASARLEAPAAGERVAAG